MSCLHICNYLPIYCPASMLYLRFQLPSTLMPKWSLTKQIRSCSPPTEIPLMTCAYLSSLICCPLGLGNLRTGFPAVEHPCAFCSWWRSSIAWLYPLYPSDQLLFLLESQFIYFYNSFMMTFLAHPPNWVACPSLKWTVITTKTPCLQFSYITLQTLLILLTPHSHSSLPLNCLYTCSWIFFVL